MSMLQYTWKYLVRTLEVEVRGGGKRVVLRKNRVEYHHRLLFELVQDREIFCGGSETLLVGDRDNLEVMRMAMG